MGNKIAFLFGAGAEHEAFNIPSGSEYTLRTMQQKHENLYNELKKFYIDRLEDYKLKEYRSKYLFEKDSSTFRKIVDRAAIKCRENCEEALIDKASREYMQLVIKYEQIKNKQISEDSEDINNEIKRKLAEVYDVIIKNARDENDESDEVAKTVPIKKYKSIKDNLSFYGAVEKDFSAIVSPNNVGLTPFWRVINYYWSAFFVILMPLCEKFEWYKECKTARKRFEYVLSNLESVISEIYKEENLKCLGERANYYERLSNKFAGAIAITTNYTPFVEHYFGENSIYLAGKLSEFEFPAEYAVKDLRITHAKDTDFVFPFMMTQAPVKPIVEPHQIKEYSRALSALDEADILVIIGYSLPQEDAHILAMVRKFVCEDNKRLIYCYHDEKGNKNEKKEYDNVINCLRLNKNSNDVNLKLIKNNGNAFDLIDVLDKSINVPLG